MIEVLLFLNYLENCLFFVLGSIFEPQQYAFLVYGSLVLLFRVQHCLNFHQKYFEY